MDFGKCFYGYYREVRGFKDEKGEKMKLFNDLSDDEKLIWIKTASYSIMQFALMFNRSIEDNKEKIIKAIDEENNDEDEEEKSE